MRRTDYIPITGTLLCETALHIGGTDDLLSTGGLDKAVIKTPETAALAPQPYIPGSSLKGRMRCLMEQKSGVHDDKVHKCAAVTCPICRVFGSPDSHFGPTRILVRDAFAVGDSGPIICETKIENVINRQSGGSANFFQKERVPPGTAFKLDLVLQIWDIDESQLFRNGYNNYDDYGAGRNALLKFIKAALDEVQRHGLGGGVSRGSGKVRILDLKQGGQDFPA